MTARATAAVFVVAAVLASGCSVPPRAEVATPTPDAANPHAANPDAASPDTANPDTPPQAAFDAARETLLAHRFVLERVDARAGIITTRPAPSSGLAMPWQTQQSSLRQEAQEFLGDRARTARITFERPTPDAPMVAVIEVTLWQRQTTNLRPAPKSITLTSQTRDPLAEAQGVPGSYLVPVERDTALEARLARDLRERLATNPTPGS